MSETKTEKQATEELVRKYAHLQSRIKELEDEKKEYLGWLFLIETKLQYGDGEEALDRTRQAIKSTQEK